MVAQQFEQSCLAGLQLHGQCLDLLPSLFASGLMPGVLAAGLFDAASAGIELTLFLIPLLDLRQAFADALLQRHERLRWLLAQRLQASGGQLAGQRLQLFSEPVLVSVQVCLMGFQRLLSLLAGFPRLGHFALQGRGLLLQGQITVLLPFSLVDEARVSGQCVAQPVSGSLVLAEGGVERMLHELGIILLLQELLLLCLELLELLDQRARFSAQFDQPLV